LLLPARGFGIIILVRPLLLLCMHFLMPIRCV
jgi:hypothetical protein